jgi:outer membrane protein assembly factor BamB
VRKPSRILVAFVALIAFAVLAAACGGVSKPVGWAGPGLSGSLYVSLDRGHLSELDAGTYEEQWRFPIEDSFTCGNESFENHELEGIYETPAIDQSTVYFGAYDDAVYALNREDGTCKWRFRTGDPVIGGTVLGTDGLYAPSSDGMLYLLNAEDGTVETSFEVGDSWTTPLLTDDAVYVATMDGKLWKLAPGTLEPIWDAPFEVSAALLTPPKMAGDDKTVLVGGIGRTLYGVDSEDGSELWSVSGGNWFWGPPAVDGTMVYATSLGGEVKAIDATSGSVAWTYDTPESVRSGPVVAGDLVVAVDNDGNIYRLSKDSGELLGTEPSDLKESVYATPLLLPESNATTLSPSAGASPSASPEQGEGGAVLLIVTRDGHLFTYDVERGLVTEVLG